MTPRRQLVLALVLCVGGALVVLLAASRSWVSWPQGDQLTVTSNRLEQSGGALRPEIQACAVVGLAGVLALLATAGWWRRALGLVLALSGALIVIRSVNAAREPLGLAFDASALSGGCPASGCGPDFLSTVSTPALWPLLAALGGVALLLSGLLTAARGHRWQRLGSSYEAPGARSRPEPATDKAVWDALDRGDDPTS